MDCGLAAEMDEGTDWNVWVVVKSVGKEFDFFPVEAGLGVGEVTSLMGYFFCFKVANKRPMTTFGTFRTVALRFNWQWVHVPLDWHRKKTHLKTWLCDCS